MNIEYGLTRFDDNLGKNYIIKSTGLRDFHGVRVSPTFSLKYVIKGTEYYKVNGRAHHVNQQNFILTNPNQKTEIEIDSKTDVDGACFFFDEAFIQQIAFSCMNTPLKNLDENVFDHNFFFEDNCLDAIYNIPVHASHTNVHSFLKTVDFQNFSSHELTEFLIRIAEGFVRHQIEINQQLKKLSATTTSTRNEQYKRLQIARQYMHDNLSKNISLKEIAQAALLSEYYFHRSFRSFFKLTPHQYLQNIRLQKAEDYMEKNYSKKEIAHLCGFQEPKYFSKVFNKWKRRRG